MQSSGTRQRAVRSGLALAASAIAMLGMASPASAIAGGAPVPNGGADWVVSLHLGSTPTTANLRCAGAHIAPEWVLTAAHCFDTNLDGHIGTHEHPATDYWASLGRTKISTRHVGEVIHGVRVILNPDNDLALLRLAAPSDAPSAALADSVPATDDGVVALGWGQTAPGQVPNRMQLGEFTVTTSTALDLSYVGTTGQSMCPADSGDPVVVGSDVAPVIVAIQTNSPAGCATGEAAATGSRVDAALGWIRRNVPFRDAYVVAARSSAQYTPGPAFSYNSAGAASTVTHDGTGRYTVRMPGLGVAAGNVQVTTYGPQTVRRCKVASWAPSGSAMLVHVRCFAPSGALANAEFVAQFVLAGPGNPVQSAYVSTPSARPALNTDVNVPGAYSYNSRGVTNTVNRFQTGSYDVDLSGFTTIGGNVAVTAIGQNSAYCDVEGWSSDIVEVLCYDHTGAPANSRFSLRYTDQSVANPHAGAYLWADDTTSPSYEPPATYAYNSTGQAITVHHISRGTYEAVLSGLPSSNSTSALVTSYGDAPTYCGVTQWKHNPGGGTAVTLTCRNAHGGLANSDYTLSYLTNH